MSTAATTRATAHATIAMAGHAGTTFGSVTLVAAFYASISARRVVFIYSLCANTFVQIITVLFRFVALK